MPVDVSLYNRPQADPIAGLGGTVGLANALTQNQILNANNQLTQGQLQGQGQYGQALMDANGNPTTATNMFTQRGGNSLYAPQAFQGAATLQGSQGSAVNTIAAGNQEQSGNAIAAMNAIANDGQPNPRVRMLNLAASLVGNGSLSSGAYHTIVDGMPANDKGASKYIQTRTAGTIAAPTQAEPIVAGYNPNTLAPIVKPKAAVVAAAGSPGGTEIVPAPGATDVAAGDRKALFEDQLRASGTMANVRPLQQALPLIQQLSNQNFGPGSPEFSKIKGALTTAGIIDPNTSDLQVRQEANKYMLKYASGANTAGRSDQALSAAVGSNPNLDLTQPANLALMKNQIGLDRMDAAMPRVFGSDAKPGQPYSDYKSGYYQANDPRAFSFDLMTPDERAKVKSSLGAPSTPSKPNPAYDRFVHSYQLAKSAGMLTSAPAGSQ